LAEAAEETRTWVLDRINRICRIDSEARGEGIVGFLCVLFEL